MTLDEKKVGFFNEKKLQKLSVDELTILFMVDINEQNLKFIEGIDFLINEDFDSYKKNLHFIIEAREIIIKKTFESKIFKSKKSSFTKADRLKLFDRISKDFMQSLVITTHNEEVAALGDRQFILDHGELNSRI